MAKCFGCFTTEGACPDTCEATILKTGRTCTGCGENGAEGTCSAGTSTTCSATSACETRSCGGTTYRCAYVSGSWRWHASATSCNDGNPCTINDACDGNTCAGNAVPDGTACAGGLCRDAACTEGECFIAGYWYTDGDPTTGCSYCDTSQSRTSWSTRPSSYRCGTTYCTDDYCSGSTKWYDYPYSCQRYCSGTSGDCKSCTCTATTTTCTAGGCCAAACDDDTGCFTTAGACPDTCGTTTLTTGRACTGCGTSGAEGTCSAGTSTTCSADNACETRNCGGTAYYCTNAGGAWAWSTSPACLGGTCKDGVCYALPMTDCDGGKLDPATNLCWQDPPSNSSMNWYEASGTYDDNYNPDTVDYCGDLVHGGHSDWRLPSIDELITLIRGCVDGTATVDLSTSLCEMSPDGCAETDDCSGYSNCSYCIPEGGPASGSYWDPVLSGFGSLLWSSSSYAGNGGRAWVVTFDFGYVDNGGKSNGFHARCVRGGP